MRKALGPFQFVPDPTQRNNPQSLRKTLYDITEREYGENLYLFAEKLEQALRTRMGRSLHSRWSDEVLYNLLNDETHFKYYHLESFARYLQIPVSLVLFYSRVRSNQDDEPHLLNSMMFRSFSLIMREAQSKSNANTTERELFNIGPFNSEVQQVDSWR